MMWLTNCSRMDLSNKSPLSLHKCYRVCGIHFEKKMYFTERLLLPSAVPTLFTTLAVEKTIATSTTSNNLCSTSSMYHLHIIYYIKVKM